MPQILVTVAAAGTPQPLSTVVRNARYAQFIAQKSLNGLSPTANTGIVAIGHSSAASQQPLSFNPGDERSYIAPAGLSFDLSRFYIDAVNTGDGIVVIYE